MHLLCCVSTSGTTATLFLNVGPGTGFIVLEDLNCHVENDANLIQCQRNINQLAHQCSVCRFGAFCSNGKSMHWMILRHSTTCMHCTLITISQSVSVHSGDPVTPSYRIDRENFAVKIISRSRPTVYTVEILRFLPIHVYSFLQKWKVVCTLFFTVGSIERCTVDVETTLPSASQIIEQ